MIAVVLLALAQLAGLLMVPLGMPGTWLQVAAIGAYAWATHGRLAWWVFAGALALSAVAEVVDFVLGARFAQRYGGGRRAGWGAILGGLVGAFVGTPVPIVGSVVGAFIGAFAGAALFELTRSPEMRSALRAGWGAFVGRLVGAAMKSAVAVLIGVAAMLAALA